MGLDVINQPLISQVNAIGALWGKNVWQRKNRSLMMGVFQHFDYYNSDINEKNDRLVAPYRISEAAAVGLGTIYYKNPEPGKKTMFFGELYANGVALGASLSDYMKLGKRDYNLGSGYSIKGGVGWICNRRFALLLNLENYHIFTWKGYDPDLDWSTVDDPNALNVQGDRSNARLTVASVQLAYQSGSSGVLFFPTVSLTGRRITDIMMTGLFHIRSDAESRVPVVTGTSVVFIYPA